MNQGLTIVPPPVVGEALRRLEGPGLPGLVRGGLRAGFPAGQGAL